MSDEFNNNILNKTGLTQRLETDLSGMDNDTAYKYVVSYITELKEIQKKNREQLNEKKIWEDREKLAIEKNKTDLASQAKEKIRGIDEKSKKYKAREDELSMTIDVLKEELKKLSISNSNQFNADKLLAELQLMAGEIDTTKKEFNNMEINEELDKIKKDLNK